MSTAMTVEAFKHVTVRIPSATIGWDLDAWKYMPTTTGSSPHPVVILAHGFAGNKRLCLDDYAELYAAEGYACVVFDYRRWGSSDGAPRHIINISEQLEDYRTVVNWARRVPEFDAKKIVIWGSSLSGGHILQLASEDPDLAAALGQCPYAGPLDADDRRSLLPPFRLLKRLFFAATDVLKQSLGFSPYYLPASSEPGDGGVLSAPGALKGYTSITKEKIHFPNQVNASCIFQFLSYNPILLAASITCPLLLVVPESDNICSMAGALEAVKNAERGEVVRTAGGHFDLYPNHSEFDRVTQAQLAFLRKHIPL